MSVHYLSGCHNELVRKVISVACEVQDWFDNREGLSVLPVVEACVSSGLLQINVNGVAVWSSGSEFDLLTRDACLQAYIEWLHDAAKPVGELAVHEGLFEDSNKKVGV